MTRAMQCDILVLLIRTPPIINRLDRNPPNNMVGGCCMGHIGQRPIHGKCLNGVLIWKNLLATPLHIAIQMHAFNVLSCPPATNHAGIPEARPFPHPETEIFRISIPPIVEGTNPLGSRAFIASNTASTISRNLANSSFASAAKKSAS